MRSESLPPIEQDEFLVAAPLLRFGPWVLMLVGVVLTASVVVASLWRIEVSRRGEYEKAFTFVAATTTAVNRTNAQLFALLRHASFSLEAMRAMPDPAAAMAAQFAASLGLHDDRIRALALDGDGRARFRVPGLDIDAPTLRRIVAALPAGGPLRATALPAVTLGTPLRAVVPVVYPLRPTAGVVTVVYLVDADALTAVFSETLNDKAGWLRLADVDGRPIVEVHRRVSAAETDRAALRAAARTIEEAMARPADYASRRLLLKTETVADTPLAVSVGLNEADLLVDLKSRVAATWTIFGIAIFVFLSLVSLTSLALRRFAIKETHLRRLATIDILTGLPNRRSFHHLLANAVQTAHRRQQTFGLMFVDLDNFKDINDSMGHEAGDELLQRVGRLLVQAVRAGDRVCRLGGDEFTVLLADLRDADEARRLAQRVMEVLAQPQRVHDFEVCAHASIGIALMPQHATSMSDLMRFADTAMYCAKQNGKSACLVYDESMAAQALVKAQRARELALAIADDDLFLEYQPKHCLRTGALVGYEALVRWRHAQRGVIPPADFIALAEEAGLIVDLGRWVLERAVRQLREWHDAGADWQRVAVNVSALQLRSGRLGDCVRDALARHGVPGAQLQIELTESSLVVDAEQARELVRQMHALGLSVAVDDFGTGYSSLSALQQFDIDGLKIDRAFVSAIEKRGGEEICRAIVELGHALKMTVVAEGVETPAQRDILRRLGCDQVQGFLYARPMPAHDVLRRSRRPLPPAPAAEDRALPA